VSCKIYEIFTEVALNKAECILTEVALNKAECVVRRTTTSLWGIHQPCGDWCSKRRNQHDKNREQWRKAINTVFNEIRQRVYVVGAREREILLIQQSIQTNTEGYLRELSGIQYMRALSLIYSQRVLGI